MNVVAPPSVSAAIQRLWPLLTLVSFTVIQEVRAAADLVWQTAADQELNIGATPVLVSGHAFDLNNDGSDDLLYQNIGLPVSSDHYPYTDYADYTFMLGDPSVPLDRTRRYSAGLDLALAPAHVAHGDLNGDGITDFVVGTTGDIPGVPAWCGRTAKSVNEISLFLGRFARFPRTYRCLAITPDHDRENPNGSKAADIQLVDLNSDGVLDIVVHRVGFNYADATFPGYTESDDRIHLVVYRGTPGETPSFQQPQFIDIAQPPETRRRYQFRRGWVVDYLSVLLKNLKVVDYDNDGDPDLVMNRLVAGQESYQLFVYSNDGAGAFNPSPRVYPADPRLPGAPLESQYADWYEALIAPKPATDDVDTLIQNVLGLNGVTPEVRDFDGDGVADFVLAASSTKLHAGNAWYLFFGIDANTHDPTPVVVPLADPEQQLFTTGDFDGNGYPDILLIHPVPDFVANSVLTPVYNMGPSAAP